MKKYAVIYLDLLGFKSFLKEDSEAALDMLRDFHEVLKERQQRVRLQPPSEIAEGQLKSLAEQNVSDSFKYLLPMSDSVFILSEEPDKAVAQLSTFLAAIFLFRGYVYSMPDSSNVLSQRVANIYVDEYEKIKRNYCWENWYPVLFRGGISYGDVEVVQIPAIYNGGEITIPNVVGQGVAQAVNLEQRGLPGPRILCDREFVDQLRGPATKYLRKEGDAWELLWPAFKYFEGDDERDRSYKLSDLFYPALALWRHYSGRMPEKHYRAFLELVVRSHLAFAQYTSDSELANEYLYRTLNESELGLCNSVLDSHLEFPNKVRKGPRK